MIIILYYVLGDFLFYLFKRNLIFITKNIKTVFKIYKNIRKKE